MSVEYRAAPGLNDFEVELADDGQGPALRLRRAVPDQTAPEPETPDAASCRRSRTPKRRFRSARSAYVLEPNLRPLRPRSRSSFGNTALSVHPEPATVSRVVE